MNHQDDCDRSSSYLSGEGYNRVRVCACGAEDHAPVDFEFHVPRFDGGWGRETTLMAAVHVDGNPS
tara:strand:+ start:24969 stop:25166 length:198 start_codon:yes stop_codon:yes gene_type:complete